jgi:hypothetical protein
MPRSVYDALHGYAENPGDAVSVPGKALVDAGSEVGNELGALMNAPNSVSPIRT